MVLLKEFIIFHEIIDFTKRIFHFYKIISFTTQIYHFPNPYRKTTFILFFLINFTVYCLLSGGSVRTTQLTNETQISGNIKPFTFQAPTSLGRSIKQLTNSDGSLPDSITEGKSIVTTNTHAASIKKRPSQLNTGLPPGRRLTGKKSGISAPRMYRIAVTARPMRGDEEGPPSLQPVAILTHKEVFQDARPSHDVIMPIVQSTDLNPTF